MEALDEEAKKVKWEELSGQERYGVVEMARRGQLAVKEVCRTFGVSRQTLHRAVKAADRASATALEPKSRGRKPKRASEMRASELEASRAELQKELEHWKTKYQVARALLDLERKLERGEALPGEKGGKKRNKAGTGQTSHG